MHLDPVSLTYISWFNDFKKLCQVTLRLELIGGFRGGSGGSLEPPFGSKLFQFHGEMYEKSGKMLKTNPLLMDLNPPFRNPGSARGTKVYFSVAMIAVSIKPCITNEPPRGKTNNVVSEQV